MLAYNKVNFENGLVLANMDKKLNQEWILDSKFFSCVQIRTCFLILKKINGGQVIMENNMACKVSGIGTIKLLHENGNILLLKGTRYVLDL